MPEQRVLAHGPGHQVGPKVADPGPEKIVDYDPAPRHPTHLLEHEYRVVGFEVVEQERAGGHVEAPVAKWQTASIRHGELDAWRGAARRQVQDLRVEVRCEHPRPQTTPPSPRRHRVREVPAPGRQVDDLESGARSEIPRQAA